MKRLILCCDGTWNTPEMPCTTNVVKIAQSIPQTDAHGVQQIVFYDEGIGTQNLMDKFAGGALGKGIDLNIQQAYRFLAQNHCPGDEIYLYGFSRGSYTVRSLAGMIRIAGMLSRSQIEWVKEAYELYRANRHFDAPAAVRFRATHQTHIPPIAFLGCWDTVEALGLPDKIEFLKLDEAFKDRYRFVNSRLGSHIQKAAHAVAIDEFRKEFDVTLMTEAPERTGEQITERWFPGDHGCAGGGTPHKRPLSDIALQWMMEETARHTDLKPDTSLIPGCEHGLATDPFIFFDNAPSVIYKKQFRKLPENAQFHESAKERFVTLPRYKERLSPAFRSRLEELSGDLPAHLTLQNESRVLHPGETAHTIIYAHKHENQTGIFFKKGGQYRITPLATQCWKDGNLAPCGPMGWNRNDPAIREQIRILGDAFIQVGEKLNLKVIDSADWFELVGRLITGGKKGPVFRIGDGSRLPDGIYTAKQDGEFTAFANDARKYFLDQYDNNKGWLIMAIKRIQ